VLVWVVAIFLVPYQAQPLSAQSGVGYAEYYILGDEDDIMNALQDIPNSGVDLSWTGANYYEGTINVGSVSGNTSFAGAQVGTRQDYAFRTVESLATAGGECLRDAADFDQPNICTAEDVRLGAFEIVSGPTTCVAGEQLTLVLKARATAGANERYDIGLYVAEDGGDAKARGSTCFRDYLNPVSADNTDVDLTCNSDRCHTYGHLR